MGNNDNHGENQRDVSVLPRTPPQFSNTVLQIPPFMEHDPELWFRIVEKACAAANIVSESAKFGTILGYLGERYTQEVRDLIMSDDADRPYSTLKEALITRLGASQEQKIRRLLEQEEMGDRKPTQYLRHLRKLGGTSFQEDAYKSIFLSRIPQTARAILAAHNDLTLDQLAAIADNIVDTLQPVSSRPQVAETSTLNPGIPSLEALLNLKFAQFSLSMKDEIAAIRREIDERWNNLDQQRRTRSPHRRRARSGSRGRSRQRATPASGICFYHWRYGDAATKCEPPCLKENFSGGR